MGVTEERVAIQWGADTWLMKRGIEFFLGQVVVKKKKQ